MYEARKVTLFPHWYWPKADQNWSANATIVSSDWASIASLRLLLCPLRTLSKFSAIEGAVFFSLLNCSFIHIVVIIALSARHGRVSESITARLSTLSTRRARVCNVFLFLLPSCTHFYQEHRKNAPSRELKLRKEIDVNIKNKCCSTFESACREWKHMKRHRERVQRETEIEDIGDLVKVKLRSLANAQTMQLITFSHALSPRKSDHSSVEIIYIILVDMSKCVYKLVMKFVRTLVF